METAIRPVTDTMHGEEIVDPYRWLEDGDSAETATWVEGQNAATRAMLDAVPGRARIEQRLTELLQIGMIGVPAVREERLFYQRREGDQNQPVLYVRDGQAGEDRVLLDPNTLSEDGTVALDWWSPSEDGQLLAYGTSSSGDERSTLRVLDVERGAALSEAITGTRAASVAWLPDASGFYYTRYPDPDPANPGAENYNRRVLFHRLGADPAEDAVVWSPKDPTDWPGVDLSRDGRWLVVQVQQGWTRSELWLRDERAGGEMLPLFTGEDAIASATFDAAGRIYLHTNLDAPRYRVYAVDPERPDRSEWREIVPERPDAVLEGAGVIGGRLALVYLRNAATELRLADLDGGNVQDVALPGIGTLAGVSGEPDSAVAYTAFSSFTTPPTIYALDPASGALTPWQRVEAPLDPSPYTVEQVWYDSTDGARVSMFLVHRRDLARTGDHPTVLTGYGGFTISRTPEFLRNLFLWLELGGVYALPNLRGGGEYGEDWHRAGMLEQKQHTFDDFYAAAEYLIRERYTNPERLGISGGSNGGLLVGAALTQRPELFRAVVCAVPLLDMLRYHHFEIAKLWIPEYGDPDNPEHYRWLRAYSPYHNVREGERYPAVLLTTGEADSRVDPMHARKMAARLQAATGSERPVLLRVEQKAGHGAGKPLTKVVEEQADVWSFFCRELGVRV